MHKITCPLVKTRKRQAAGLPKVNGRVLATLLAFGAGLMAAAMSSGLYV